MQKQVLLDKQLLAQKVELKYNMIENHKSVMRVFERVGETIENPKSVIEIQNGLNRVAFQTYAANGFFQEAENESDHPELKKVYLELKKEFSKDLQENSNPLLQNYMNYYESVLKGSYPEEMIPYVKVEAPRSKEHDETLLKNLLDGYVIQQKVNDDFYEGCQNDPLKAEEELEKKIKIEAEIKKKKKIDER